MGLDKKRKYPKVYLFEKH